MATDSTLDGDRHISTSRATIRKWADRHDMVPVRRGPDETLDLVPEVRVGAEHDRLDWNAFHDDLEAQDRAVFYNGDATEAPLEVPTHDQATARGDSEAEDIRNRLAEGETVTSTIQETSAVETGVVEEATLESTLVGREIIHEELLDVDLVERTCTEYAIVSSDDFEDADTFDHDRYFASLRASRDESTEPAAADASSVAPSLPYTSKDTYQARIDVREVWIATREVTERFTVESHITGTDVAEAETFEDYDVDVEGVQRSIVAQGMLDVEQKPDEAMQEFDVESELGEGDQMHTHFTRTSVVEDRVTDQVRAYADIARADFAEMEFEAVDTVVSEKATETMGLEAESASLTRDDVGKDVVDATGSTVGTVKEITDGGQTAYVDPHSSVTESVLSALGWGDEDEHDMEIYAGQFASIDNEKIQLKAHEELAEHRETHGHD